MHWIVLLGLGVLAAGLAAVTGISPDDTRPAGRTRLMTAARWILVIVAAGLAVGTLFAVL